MVSGIMYAQSPSRPNIRERKEDAVDFLTAGHSIASYCLAASANTLANLAGDQDLKLPLVIYRRSRAFGDPGKHKSQPLSPIKTPISIQLRPLVEIICAVSSGRSLTYFLLHESPARPEVFCVEQ